MPMRSIWRELNASGGLVPFLLLCLGIWLHAADSLVTATLMPAAIGDIGGVAYINWTIALYQVGSIVTGAAAGTVASRHGLRAGILSAALVYTLGSVMSALAPDMAVMLVGRLVQGVGGGMMLALSYVAIQSLFPERLWTQLFAIESMVWGVAALCGPLLGGLFSDWGWWRGAFWSFALQGVVLALAVLGFMQPAKTPAPAGDSRWSPWPLAILFGATLMIAEAGVMPGVWLSLGLGLAGLAALYLAARLDQRSAARMLPGQLLEARHTVGAGLLMVFTLAASTTAFWSYGPLILKAGFGVDALVIGYVLAAESLVWTGATLLVSRAPDRRQPLLIRIGAAIVAVGATGFVLFLPIGSLAGVIGCVLMQGAGFGMSWPFIVRRIVAHADTAEKALAAGAAPTIQRVGYAVGAAATGIAANAAGLGDGLSIEAMRLAAVWVFAAFVPLLAAANWAAYRFALPARDDAAAAAG